MHDQPEPTEREEEQAPEQLEEQEAMQYPGHENPEDAEPQDEEEIHDV